MVRKSKQPLRRKAPRHPRTPRPFGVDTQSSDYQTLMVMSRRPDVIPRPLPKPPTYNIPLVYEVGIIVAGSAAPAIGVITPTASQFPASTFLSGFDKYRIISLTVVFKPIQNVCNNPASFPGFIATVIDYDNATPLTSMSQALAYDTVQHVSMLETTIRNLEPSVAIASYAGGAFTGYIVAKGGRNGPWLDNVSNTTPYFGLKYITDQTQLTTASAVVSATVTAHFQFKNPI